MDYNAIILPWINNSRSNEYRKNRGYHTGVDITADVVTSFASGVVINIGKKSDGYAVTVQYDAANSLRYLHLKSVKVSAGATVVKGQEIGIANRFVHFEYITTQKTMPIWTVRIGKITYYKHDPTPLIEGTIILDGPESDNWYDGVWAHVQRPEDEIDGGA